MRVVAEVIGWLVISLGTMYSIAKILVAILKPMVKGLEITTSAVETKAKVVLLDRKKRAS